MKITNPKHSTAESAFNAETLGYKTGQAAAVIVSTAAIVGLVATAVKLVWWIWQQPW